MGNGSSVNSPKGKYVIKSIKIKASTASTPTNSEDEALTPPSTVKNVVVLPPVENVPNLFDTKGSQILSMFIGAQLCSQNEEVRNAFFDFLQEMSWFDLITNNPSNHLVRLYNDEINLAVCFNQYCLAVRSVSTDACDGVNGFSKAQIMQQLKINDAKDLDVFRSRTSIQTCLSHVQLNPFILGGLWNYFYESPQFQEYSKMLSHKILDGNKTNISQQLQQSEQQLQQHEEEQVQDLMKRISSNNVEHTQSMDSTITCPGTPFNAASPRISIIIPPHGTEPSSSRHSSFGIANRNDFSRSSGPSSSYRSSFISTKSAFTPIASPGNSIKEKRIKDIYFQAIDDQSNINNIKTTLASGSWATELIATLDNHTRSLCISAAGVENRGFPLIYVNKAFETLTQYTKSEALGRCCGTLLRCDRTEVDQTRLLSEALRGGMGCKVALTNRRKDGTEFLNMLATHPVYNARGQLTYMVAVQYDVTRHDASLKEIKQIDDLLRLVGNVLKH